jgi:hypothetical protein
MTPVGLIINLLLMGAGIGLMLIGVGIIVGTLLRKARRNLRQCDKHDY